MDIVFDILIVQPEVKEAIAHADFCIIHILWLQIDVSLLVMVLIVVTDTVVQLSE